MVQIVELYRFCFDTTVNIPAGKMT